MQHINNQLLHLKSFYSKLSAITPLVGALFATSCSDDYFISFDDEWNGIPRAMSRTKGDQANLNFHRWSGGECAAVALAYSKHNTANISEFNWGSIATALAGSVNEYRNHSGGYDASTVKDAGNSIGVGFTTVALTNNAIYSLIY